MDIAHARLTTHKNMINPFLYPDKESGKNNNPTSKRITAKMVQEGESKNERFTGLLYHSSS